MQLVLLHHTMVTPPQTSESYFRTLFEACGEAFFVTNDMGQAIDCNEAALRLHGCQRSDILGTTPLDWSPPWQPNGRRSEEWAAEIFARAAAGETVRFEWENFRLDRTPVFVSVTVRRTAVDGQPCYLVISRDISDQRRSEEALRDAHERTASILAGISDGFFVLNEQFQVTHFNPAAERLLGRRRDEVIGRPLFDAFPEARGSVFETNYTKALRERCFLNFEVNFDVAPLANWYDVRVHPIGGGIAVFFQVTTERKKAEQALHESQATFRKLFDDSADAILLIDQNRVFVECNQAALDLLKMPREAFLHRPPVMISPEYQPNGRRSDEAAQDMMDQAYAKGLHRFDWTCVNAEGGEFIVEVSLMPLMIVGQVMLHTTWRDITERKRVENALRKSELHFRNIIQALPIPLALNNEMGDITYLNSAFTDTFGYTNDEIQRLEDWWPRAYPDSEYRQWVMDTWQKHLDSATRNGTTFEPLELTIHARDGSTRSVFVSAASLDDNFRGEHLVMLVDITERKKTEQILMQSVQDKKALLNEVHHRVKNNLQVIVSLLRMEARRSAQQEIKTVLADMQGRIHSMALLHESLYRNGIFASVDLGSYLRTLANQVFRGQNDYRDAVRLLVDCTTVQVSMDLATPCGLLVNELISNCLKHGFPKERSGEVRVTLHAVNGQTPSGDALWCLKVSDSGVGLPPKFEVDGARSIGLQLVGDLSRQIGGTLTIESQPGTGATFSVVFKVPEPTVQA